MQTPGAEMHAPVQPGGKAGRVGDHQKPSTRLCHQPQQKRHDGITRRLIQIARRLIGQHQTRARGQGAANGHALLLAARQFGRCVVLAPLQTHRLQRLRSGTAALGRVVYFDFDSFVVKDEFRSLIDGHAKVLAAQRNKRLVVEGHTDSSPINSERFPSNWELSSARAAAVARYLSEQGVAPHRLQASGYADTRPMAAPWNPVDRAVNRRVELTMETPKAQSPT